MAISLQADRPPLRAGSRRLGVVPPPLRRRFRAIIFDWDGTAVLDRQEDATELARLLRELLRFDVRIVVVTGTSFSHVDHQLCRLLPPAARRGLLVCTNRGSEVYGFEPDGTAVRRWLRVATPDEEQALTTIAEVVRDTIVHQTGLEIRIVYDRLNRRKIDLIPLPEWADPPKARIGELLAAVEQRLRVAGLAEGLAEVVALAERLARDHGLPDARITSDVKHVEVGLTDKGDALAWIKRHLLQPRRIPLRATLIAGDEFGPIAGFPGSDDRLRAGAEDAIVISVGAEPNSVPEGVLHLGGGPPRFRALLADQVRRHDRAALRAGGSGPTRRPTLDPRPRANGWVGAALVPSTDPAWRMEHSSYRLALEHEVESRFALGNGFLGVRASLEQPTIASRPRTFVAGLFETPNSETGVPLLIPTLDWSRFRLALNGHDFSLDTGDLVAHRRVLDLRRGLLLSEVSLREPTGQIVRVRTLRFVSLADRALAVQVAQVDADQPTGVTLGAWLEPLSQDLELVRASPGLCLWRTRRSGRRLAVATAAVLAVAGTTSRPALDSGQPWTWSWQTTPGQPATFTRLMAIARGDTAEDPSQPALAALRRARRLGPARALAAHSRAWAARWAAADVLLEGDESAQRALRFAVYHLLSAANPEDDRTSIGARALTGDAYLGHVFWDTEIFLLPFYTFTWPAAARALLMYRYHTLPAARAKAKRLGFRGALYAWESADTGEEVTPSYVFGPDGRVIPIRCGTDEQHISADVAYAVWQYWQVTEDVSFLLEAGAEILLETARFWASRATLEDDHFYHIRGVIGPDEYHEGVDDNAYTNGMARWNLERGLEVARLLHVRWPESWQALSARLGLTEDELARWLEVAAHIRIHVDPSTGLVEQFTGFFQLEPIDVKSYEPRTAPIDVLLGPERTRGAQVIKQADVVMLLALLWERVDPTVREASFRYYEARCGHGSSLSPPIHALVAARLGDVELGEQYFHQSAAIDLDDTMGNAALGIHIGALGGLWQAIVFGFAGLTLCPDGLRFEPHLPPSWEKLQFRVQWRGRQLRIDLAREPCTLTATLERGQPLRLYLGGLTQVLGRGKPWTCRQGGGEARWSEASQ